MALAPHELALAQRLVTALENISTFIDETRAERAARDERDERGEQQPEQQPAQQPEQQPEQQPAAEPEAVKAKVDAGSAVIAASRALAEGRELSEAELEAVTRPGP